MKRITVNQLAKTLNKIIEEGNGRLPVVVAKHTFTNNCESDGVTIMEMCGIEVDAVRQADDDGGTKVNKDGSEVYRRNAVIFGNAHESKADMEARKKDVLYEFAIEPKHDAATISRFSELYPDMRRDFERLAVEILRDERKDLRP